MSWDYMEARPVDIDDSGDISDSNSSCDAADNHGPSMDEIPEENFNIDALDEKAPELSDFNGTNEEDTNSDYSEGTGGSVLRRDPSILWQSGVNAIDDAIEAMRDDLRDKGMEDGPQMEAIVMHERMLQMEELARNIEGDFSQPYTPPDFSINFSNDADGSTDTIASSDASDVPITNSVTPDADDSSEEAKDVELLEEESFTVDDTSAESQSVDSMCEQDYTKTLAVDDSLRSDESTDVSPIDDVSDWIGDINPNFDEFDPESPFCNNCGSCAFAVYQRLEGVADCCATANNINYNSEMEALTGMEQISMSPDEIEMRLLAEGDGAHAIIGIDRAQGPGHWFNAACIDGRVVAIDGQSGDICEWPPDYGDVVNWEMSIKRE